MRLSIIIRSLGTGSSAEKEVVFPDRGEISTDYISSMRRLEPSFLGGEFDPLVLTQVELLGLVLECSREPHRLMTEVYRSGPFVLNKSWTIE